MRKTKPVFLAIFAVLTIFVASTFSQAASDEAARVDAATAVLKEVMAIPEGGIPEALLNNSYGVAVIPSVIKAGFIGAARYGQGVLVTRHDDGSWSSPAFISLAGGSVGFQAGLQSTDTILVFKSKKSIDAISRGKFTLGADASVAVGPVGRYASANTDIMLKAEIFSYSRSRGAFAGVALEGAVLSMNHDANEEFYARKGITPNEIFAMRGKMPPVAKSFTCTLAGYTRTKMAICG
jgi:lipid-binding SYLF domain-containing protein